MTTPPPGVPGASPVYRFAAWIAFTTMHVQRWRFDVREPHHVPLRGGAVIAANHTSFWDYFTAGRHPYLEHGRPVRILAREDLFTKPVFGFAMRRAEHIPVHRSRGGDALASAVEALRRGELVLVLPEQTISRSFELLDFKTGAARMAAAAGVPLVPTVTWGTHRFNTVGHPPRWRWRLPVTVAYDAPLHPTPEDDPVEVTARLRARMTEMVHAVQDDYPDTPRADEDPWWVPARLGGSAPTHEQVLAEQAQLRAAWRKGHHRLGPRDLMRAAERRARRGRTDDAA